MTPRENGVLLYKGRIRSSDAPQQHEPAITLATGNALAAAQALLRNGEDIETILQLTVYLAAEEGFLQHSRVADFASLHLMSILGPRALGARAAVGVTTLPGDATVEVQLVATARESPRGDPSAGDRAASACTGTHDV